MVRQNHDRVDVKRMLCHGAAEAFAQALDVALLGEQLLPLVGDDGEEEASAWDVGAAIVAHGGVEPFGWGWPVACRVGWWNRCACSTLRRFRTQGVLVVTREASDDLLEVHGYVHGLLVDRQMLVSRHKKIA